MAKQFLYLVQTESTLPASYRCLITPSSDLICLSWKERVEGHLFLPESTWTQGRNRLLIEAMRLGHKYEYYIFFDDDVVFSCGSWQDLEALLLEYRPAIGVPGYDCYKYWTDREPGTRAVYSHDAIYSAIHREILEDGLIIPYYGGFDASSWWASQLILIHLTQFFYPSAVYRFRDVAIENRQHRSYQRLPEATNFARYFGLVEDWLLTPGNLFSETEPFRRSFIPISETGMVHDEAIRRNGRYRATESKRRTLNPNSKFWRSCQRLRSNHRSDASYPG